MYIPVHWPRSKPTGSHLCLEHTLPPLTEGVVSMPSLGPPQSASLYSLDSLMIREHERRNLTVVELELGPDLRVDGLLGMSWLSPFAPVCVDVAAQTLTIHTVE